MYGLQKFGHVEPYVIADLYAWLEAHSGLSNPYVGTPSSTLVAITLVKNDSEVIRKLGISAKFIHRKTNPSTTNWQHRN